MAYDNSVPVSSRTLRKSAGYLRDNFQQLETALSEGHQFTTGGTQDGKHTTPTFVDNGATPSQPTTANEVVLYNNGGMLYSLNQAGSVRSFDPIPAGTKMIFKQTSAPTGWTFVAEDNDRVLLNTSTAADGGTTGGNWVISGLNVAGCTLSMSEIPDVTGTIDIGRVESSHIVNNTTGCFSHNLDGGVSGQIADQVVGATPASDRISFSLGGGGGSHSHNISQDGSWRPNYVNVITCTKD